MLTAGALACLGRGLWNAGKNHVQTSRLIEHVQLKPIIPMSKYAGRGQWNGTSTPLYILQHKLRVGETFRHIRTFEPTTVKDDPVYIGDKIMIPILGGSHMEEKNPASYVDAKINPVNNVDFIIPRCMPVFMTSQYQYAQFFKQHTDAFNWIEIQHKINILSHPCHSNMLCIQQGELLAGSQKTKDALFLLGSTHTALVSDGKPMTRQTTFKVQKAGTDLYALAKNAGSTREVLLWIMAGLSISTFAWMYGEHEPGRDSLRALYKRLRR